MQQEKLFTTEKTLAGPKDQPGRLHFYFVLLVLHPRELRPAVLDLVVATLGQQLVYEVRGYVDERLAIFNGDLANHAAGDAAEVGKGADDMARPCAAGFAGIEG